MEQEYKSTDQSESFDAGLSLPQFDEDATLLSARPVVPLREVQAETRSRRPMIFVLTIVAAVLVGAIGATLLLIQSDQHSGGEEGQVSQPVEPSSGAAGGSEPNPVESKAQLPTVAEDKPALKEVERNRASGVDSRQPAANLRSYAKSGKASKAVEDGDEDGEERELRRAERREARRLNREARREWRQRREQTGDDLLRIREIFEGSPRP